jgi:integrase
MKVWGLPRNPVADVERPRYRVSDDVDAFSPEEVLALVRAAASDQDAAMFMTAAFTGLRTGELLAHREEAFVVAGLSLDEYEEWLALFHDVGGEFGRVAAADVAH